MQQFDVNLFLSDLFSNKTKNNNATIFTFSLFGDHQRIMKRCLKNPQKAKLFFFCSVLISLSCFACLFFMCCLNSFNWQEGKGMKGMFWRNKLEQRRFSRCALGSGLVSGLLLGLCILGPWIRDFIKIFYWRSCCTKRGFGELSFHPINFSASLKHSQVRGDCNRACWEATDTAEVAPANEAHSVVAKRGKEDARVFTLWRPFATPSVHRSACSLEVSAECLTRPLGVSGFFWNSFFVVCGNAAAGACKCSRPPGVVHCAEIKGARNYPHVQGSWLWRGI